MNVYSRTTSLLRLQSKRIFQLRASRRRGKLARLGTTHIEILEQRIMLKADIWDGNRFSHGSVYDYAPTVMAGVQTADTQQVWWGTQNGTDPARNGGAVITGDQIWYGTATIGGSVAAGSTLITRYGPVNSPSFPGWNIVISATEDSAYEPAASGAQIGWADFHVNDPSVIYFGNQYVMYFDGSNNSAELQAGGGISKNLMGRATWDGVSGHSWVVPIRPTQPTTDTKPNPLEQRVIKDPNYPSAQQYARYGVGEPSAVAHHVDSHGAVDGTGVTITFYNETYDPTTGFVLRSNWFATSTDGITFGSPIRLDNIPSQQFTYGTDGQPGHNAQIPNGNTVLVAMQSIDDIAWSASDNVWYISTSEIEHDTLQSGVWAPKPNDSNSTVIHIYKTTSANLDSALIQIAVVDKTVTSGDWNFGSGWVRNYLGDSMKEVGADTAYDDNKFLLFASGSSSSASWELSQVRTGATKTASALYWLQNPNSPYLDFSTSAYGEEQVLANTYGYTVRGAPYYFTLNAPYYYHVGTMAVGASEYPNDPSVNEPNDGQPRKTFNVGGTNYVIHAMYRLYNPNVSGLHFYTTSYGEKQNLVRGCQKTEIGDSTRLA